MAENTGHIQTLFKDREQTQAIFPRTKTSAVTDDEGRNLETILENSVYVGDWLVAEDTVYRDADTLGGTRRDEFYTKTEIQDLINDIVAPDIDPGTIVSRAELEANYSTTEKLMNDLIPSSAYTLSSATVISRETQELDLNNYLEIGAYKCSIKDVIKTLKNCPTSNFFKMFVSNPIPGIYSSQGVKYEYRTQEIFTTNDESFVRNIIKYENGKNSIGKWYKNFNSKLLLPSENGGIGLDISENLSQQEHLKCCDRFVEEMNKNAIRYGLKNSTFKTPSGLCTKPVKYASGDSIEYNSYTTAYDLLRLVIAARYTPAVYEAMSCHSFSYFINEGRYITTNIITGSSSWKNWASEGYTVLAGKGGSLGGKYGEIGINGILTMALLVKDSEGNIYAASAVGFDNPVEWKETTSYPIGRKVKIEWSDGVTTTHVSLKDNNLGNEPSQTTDTEYWGLLETEGIILRRTLGDFIECIKDPSKQLSEQTEQLLIERPYLGIAVVKISNEDVKKYEDDIAFLDYDEHASSRKFYNEHRAHVAASTTKILNALTVAPMLTNHICTVSEDDLVGGSGSDVSEFGDRVPSTSALFMMMGYSDNHMATMLARIYGKKLLDSDSSNKSNRNLIGKSFFIKNQKESPIHSLKIYGRTEIVKPEDAESYQDLATPGIIKNAREQNDNVSLTIYSGNFLNTKEATTERKNNATFVLCEDGSIRTSGTANADTAFDLLPNEGLTIPDGEYILSGNVDNNGQYKIILVTKDNQEFVNDGPECRVQITGGGLSRAYLFVEQGISVKDRWFYPKLRLATDANKNFITSDKQLLELQIDSNLQLSGIPVDSNGNYTDSNGQQWVCDEIDVINNKYIQRIGKVVVDNNTAWYRNSRSTSGGYGSCYCIIADLNRKIQRAVLSDMVPTKDSSRPRINNLTPQNAVLVFFDYFNIGLSLEQWKELNDETMVAAWKNYLAAHPLTVYYIKDEPEEFNLASEQLQGCRALHIYDEDTIITNNLNANMEIKHYHHTSSLPESGGRMSGDIDMFDNKLTGLPAPQNESDAVNKKYVDQNFRNSNWLPNASDVGALPIVGGNMQGTINMGGHVIWGLPDPTGYDQPIHYRMFLDELAKKAPSGYGLGESDREKITSITDCNTAFANGWYRVRGAVNVPTNGTGSSPHSYGWMLVSTGDFTRQDFYTSTTDPQHWVRYYVDGKWGEWCCKNPPMLPGVEYRTTERYEGKPVYAFHNVHTLESTFSGNAHLDISTGIRNADECIRHHAKLGYYFLPYVDGGTTTAVEGLSIDTGMITLRNTGTGGWNAGYQLKYTLYYTKTKD